jgi:hypothetical protein
MAKRRGRAVLLMGAVLVFSSPALAATIGINFGAVVGGGGPSGGSSQIPNPTANANGDGAGIAGAPGVAQGNWNDTWQGSGPSSGMDVHATSTATNLRFNTGTPSGAAVAWRNAGSSDPGGNDQFPTSPALTDGANFELYQGYLDTDDNTTTYVDVTNLPSSITSGGYDLYVYFLGSVSSRGGTYGVSPLFTNPPGQPHAVPGTTFQPTKLLNAQAVTFDTDLNAWVGSGPQANGSDLDPGAGIVRFQEDPGASTTDFGNYALFRGLTASDFTLWASTLGDSSNGLQAGEYGFGDRDRAPISGIQIVPVPEPASVGVVAGASLLLLRRRSR